MQTVTDAHATCSPVAGMPPDNTSLVVRAVVGAAGLAEIASAWDDLFARATQGPLHMSRAWLGTFVSCGRMRGAPTAITVWSGERLAGLLLLAVRRRAGLRVAEPVGTGQPAYLGLLADPGFPEVASAVAAFCRRERPFDLLGLYDVSSDDVVTQNLLSELARCRCVTRRVPRAVCWYIRLGCSFQDYLTAEKSKKSQQTLRRKERRLESAARVAIESYSGPEVTDAIVDRMARIQEESWMKRRGAANIGDAFHRQLVRNVASANMARVWFLTLDGEDAAFEFVLVAHGRLHYAYPAFKLKYQSLSVGTVLTMRSIQASCESGLQVYDFGHGDADYKRFWANASHQVERVFVGRGIGGCVGAVLAAAAWRLAAQPIVRGWFLRLFRRRQVENAEE